MKRITSALVLALALTGTLTACGRTNNTPNSNGGTDNSAAGSSTNQVTRRNNTGDWIFQEDGQYSAGSNGQVYNGRFYDGRTYGGLNNSVARDLTRGADDIVRDTGDAIGDMGRGVGNAVEDIGNGVGNAIREY